MDADDLVTLDTFESVMEAELAAGLLEAAGITCTLADDHLVGMAWHLSTAVGGVRLFVRREDLEAAAQVLESELPTQEALADEQFDDAGFSDEDESR